MHEGYATYCQLNAPWLHINVITISLNKKNKNITRKKKLTLLEGCTMTSLLATLTLMFSEQDVYTFIGFVYYCVH